MLVEYPWPEDQQRVEARVRSLVESVLRPGELQEVRLEGVTPYGHRWDGPDADRTALLLMVIASGNEIFEKEIWGPGRQYPWEHELGQLASDLEDWVCETSFGWGEQRVATLPE